MASNVAVRGAPWRERIVSAVMRSSGIVAGIALILAAILFAVALATYHRSDPALNTVAGGPPLNWIGAPGAWIADLGLTLFGPAAAAWVPIILVPGIRLVRGRDSGRWGRAALLTLLAALLVGTAVALFREETSLWLPAGWGGALGYLGSRAIEAGIGLIPAHGFVVPLRYGIELVAAGIGLWLWITAIGLEADERAWLARAGRGTTRPVARVAKVRTPRREAAAIDDDDDDEPYVAPAKKRAATADIAPPPSRPIIADRSAGTAPRKPEGRPRSISATNMCCPRSTCSRPRRPTRARRSTRPRSSATRSCSSPCSTISTSRALSARCAPARWSRCTSSSPRPASRRAA